jgi:hypothetical protein
LFRSERGGVRKHEFDIDIGNTRSDSRRRLDSDAAAVRVHAGRFVEPW